MKKFLLTLSLLLTVALMSAQTDDYGKFAYGFGAAAGEVGNSSFVMGLPFFSQPETEAYSVSEGVMQAQLVRFNLVLEGCQNEYNVSPEHVKDTSGFFPGYEGEEIVFDGETIRVFPAGHYDSTAYNAGHYSWNAQYNYDSLTTLDLYVWQIYELFDTLYLDSTEIVTDYAHNVLMIPTDIDQALHGGPNIYRLATVEHNCDSIRHFFVNLCGGTVTDADGNTYNSVYIGEAPMRYCWTKANMETTKYLGGVDAPNMIYDSETHPDEVANLNTYGRLYNWYSAVNIPFGSNDEPAKTTNGGFVTGICPSGWHLPDSANLLSLNQLNALDLMSDILWLVPGNDTGAGFYALPAGIYRHINNRFENMLGQTTFWSSVRHSYTECWVCSLVFGCNKTIYDDMTPENGASVRCVKNQMYADDGSELND